MMSGVFLSIFVLCPLMITCLPISENDHLQTLQSTNVQNINLRTPTKHPDEFRFNHGPSQRLFHTRHQMFSLAKLENLKNIITSSERAIDFVGIALREFERTGVFSASKQLLTNVAKQNITLIQYDEILSTLMSIVCSAENGLQTIEMSVRYRHLYGLENETSRVEKLFHTANQQLKSLQTTISAVHDGGNTQCRFSPTPMIPIQEYLNFNIVMESKQIIQNLTYFVAAINYTINDCQTAEILLTFLSRAVNLIPGISNAKIYHPAEAAYVFNQSIRYQWNGTEQQLCKALREIQAVKTLMETHNSGTEDTQTVDDVIYNIQNSLSALGTVNLCTGKSSSPVRVTNIENHSQNALTRLIEILLKLDSYKKSKFCSHQ